MKFILLLIALGVGVAARPQTVVRTPSLDSAVVQSRQDGGNFAYSVNEENAYGIQLPIFPQGFVPAPFKYNQRAPILRATSFAQPIVYSQQGVVPTDRIFNSPSFAYSQITPQLYSAFNPYAFAGFYPNFIPGSQIRSA